MRHDHHIQAAVLAQLDFEPAINASHIGVAVRDGVVTLSGHVPSLADRALAARSACHVSGVKAVVDQLSVELPGEAATADEIVARLAYDRLATNQDVPVERLQLTVADGVVTVGGDVDWNYQREAAVEDLRRLSCVKDVVSEIAIRPPVEAAAISDRIGGALERLGLHGADSIRVQAEGSRVTLSGTVTSWREKQLAESVAWSAPGVTHVENAIAVA